MEEWEATSSQRPVCLAITRHCCTGMVSILYFSRRRRRRNIRSVLEWLQYDRCDCLSCVVCVTSRKSGLPNFQLGPEGTPSTAHLLTHVTHTRICEFPHDLPNPLSTRRSKTRREKNRRTITRGFSRAKSAETISDTICKHHSVLMIHNKNYVLRKMIIIIKFNWSLIEFIIM